MVARAALPIDWNMSTAPISLYMAIKDNINDIFYTMCDVSCRKNVHFRINHVSLCARYLVCDNLL